MMTGKINNMDDSMCDMRHQKNPMVGGKGALHHEDMKRMSKMMGDMRQMIESGKMTPDEMESMSDKMSEMSAKMKQMSERMRKEATTVHKH